MNKKIMLVGIAAIVAMLIFTVGNVLAACTLCGTPIRNYPVQFYRPAPVQFSRPAPVQFYRPFNINRCDTFVISRPRYTTAPTTFKLPSFFGCQGICQRFVFE